jgi:hypothetical protein
VTRRNLFVVAVVAATLVALPALASLNDPVISSNEPLPFPQNGQNEPALAIDPMPNGARPMLVVGGNEYRDQSVCESSSRCAFKPGIGISGVYYSDDRRTFIRGRYTGAAVTAAGLTSIRTLPGFSTKMWSFGDPALAAGPRFVRGKFRWLYGTRFYYATLARLYQPDKARVIAVSSSDPTRLASQAPQPTWSRAAQVSQARVFTVDKPAIWADDAEFSALGETQVRNPNFGHVYVCWTVFTGGAEQAGGQIWFARSLDGGVTWVDRQQLSTITPPQAQGCTIRSDSNGRVYVFWRDRVPSASEIQSRPGIACAKLAQSADGRMFTPPTFVAPVLEPGWWDPTQAECTGDGITGARINSSPTIDIANGAPTGAGTNTIALAITEGPSDRVVVRTSHDLAATWSSRFVVSRSGDNPAFAAVALAPKGRYIFVVYAAFLQGWQQDTSQPRWMQAVVRKALVADLEAGAPAWAEGVGVRGDARASAGFEGGDAGAKPVRVEFMGDSSAIVATEEGANAAWTDVSAAADCPEVDKYRQTLVDNHGKARPIPAVRKLCAPQKGLRGIKTTFGNTTLCGLYMAVSFTGYSRETRCAWDVHK